MSRPGSAALVAALALAACGSAQVPELLKSDLAGSPPGTTTLIVFSDYECGACRSTHFELMKALQGAGQVRIVRHHVPLPSHPHAEIAARAAICVETLGARADRMDDELFAAGSARLDEASCEEMAASQGVDRDRFNACLTSPQTSARLRRDMEAYLQAGGRGVPLLYVGHERIEGAQDSESLVSALRRARGR